MRVAIVDSQVAFIHGGAELLRSKLAEGFRAHGHDVDLVLLPLAPSAPEALASMLDFASALEPAKWDAPPDAVVALRWPAYLVRHPAKRVWLLHQFRQYYEYYGQTRSASNDAARLDAVRARVVESDTQALREANLWVMSNRIAERLREFNGVEASRVLLPPLPRPDGFYRGRYDHYVFAPSRLEKHKRQGLLIEAMAHVKADVKAVIAGEGGAYEAYARRIEALGLRERVLLTGRLDDAVQAAWYANSLAVFFGPEDEDYGYITLEAMASGKAVITCRDSGGPLMFVEEGANGHVVEPDPHAIAERIEALAAAPQRARAMGECGYDKLQKLDLSWARTAGALLA